MKTLIMLSAVPAAGKTTWAKNYQKELYRYDGYGKENNKKKDVRIMGFCPYTQK